MSDDATLETASVPVTIITGFLGAGKTTLLKHVLASPHGLRIAVIQNELSAAQGLETSSVIGPNGETFDEWLELSNGCVCCAVRDDLVNGIEQLMSVRGRFDYILVETTGMADPGPVAESFWLDRELESPLRLDGIVTVVDGLNLPRQLGELEACRQIGCADAILLNKTDLVLDAARSELEAAPALISDGRTIEEAAEERCSAHINALLSHLSELNALAPVLRTTRSQVSLHSILHLGAFDASRPIAFASSVAPSPFASFGTFVKPGANGCVPRAGDARTRSELLEPPAGARGGEICSSELPAVAGCATDKQRAPRASAEMAVDGHVRTVPRMVGRAFGRQGAATLLESPADGVGLAALSEGRWLHRDSTFGAVTIEEPGDMELAKVEALFAALFWDPSDFPAAVVAARELVASAANTEIHSLDQCAAADECAAIIAEPEMYRSKGVIAVAGSSRKYLLQAVHATYELVEGPEWQDCEQPRTRIVFIGRNLDSNAITATLRACKGPPSHPSARCETMGAETNIA